MKTHHSRRNQSVLKRLTIKEFCDITGINLSHQQRVLLGGIAHRSAQTAGIPATTVRTYRSMKVASHPEALLYAGLVQMCKEKIHSA